MPSGERFFADDSERLLLGAFQVGARRGVHANHLSGFDKLGDLHDEARFNFRGLRGARRRRPLHSGLRFHDREVHGLGQLHSHGPPFVEVHLEADVGDQIVDGLSERLLVEVSLLVGLGVHEVVEVAVAVQVFHFLLVQVRRFDAVFGAEPVLQLGAGLQVAQGRLHHSPPVSRGDVQQLHDPAEVPVVDDDHSRFELSGVDHVLTPVCNLGNHPRRERDGTAGCQGGNYSESLSVWQPFFPRPIVGALATALRETIRLWIGVDSPAGLPP